jgi:hypothetical protein
MKKRLSAGMVGLLMGCAAPTPPPASPLVQTEERAPAVAPAPQCPASIRREPAVETELFGTLSAGTWVPSTQLASFGKEQVAHADPPWQERFRKSLTLKSGAVEAVGLSQGTSAGMVAFFAAHGTGACVVNTWGTGVLGLTDLEATDIWVAPDGMQALLLLKLPLKPKKGAASTHWVVLATDGQRVWLPLSGAGGTHAIAPHARFRRQKRLFLDLGPKRGPHKVFTLEGERFVALN